MSDFFHTVIIGAGASGLFCAGSFSERKLVLEGNKKPALKVSVSGGGKCNFTNAYASAADYVCTQKHFCKSALSAFGPKDFIQLLQQNSLDFEERPGGQFFGKNAADLVRFLVRRAQQNNTQIELNTRVLGVQKMPGGFTVLTSRGKVETSHVVLACGGISFPALGASNFGVQTAQKFGLKIVPQRPALCGLVWPKEYAFLGALTGNAVPARVSCGKHAFENALLFTHDGISGPAVLNTSLFWDENKPVSVNFLPSVNALDFLRAHKTTKQTVSQALSGEISPKITRALLGELDVRLPDISKDFLLRAAARLNAFTFIPARTSGYTKAEVTAGGVDTTQINPSTMEVKSVPGLYIIGELLDVTGRLGGFNLQWAWSSGAAAAKALDTF